MNEDFLRSRRNLLVNGSKTFAAALGILALSGSSRSNYSFASKAARDMEQEAEEILTSGPQETCTLTGAQTLGPCYAAAAALTRRDITAGATGLPMRLGFRIVNAANCQPVTNATVDVWHVNSVGIYSALTAQVCTTGANVVNETWCRGVQATDSDGRVYFDSVFPGWYSSRTTHIHFTIRIGTTIFLTSQFAFSDRANDFIYRKHPLYNTRAGTRGTNNTNDTVFTTSNISQYIFETRYKAGTGKLQAFKTIGISI